MNKYNTTAFILVALFFISTVSFGQNGDSFQYNESEGLGKVKIENPKTHKQLILNEENLKEHTDIREWMKNKGLEYNDSNLEKVSGLMQRYINALWNQALNELMNCDHFKDYNTGYNHQLMKERLEDGSFERDIYFDPSPNVGADAPAADASGNKPGFAEPSGKMGTVLDSVTVSLSPLFGLVHHIGGQRKENKIRESSQHAADCTDRGSFVTCPIPRAAPKARFFQPSIIPPFHDSRSQCNTAPEFQTAPYWFVHTTGFQ